MGVGGDRTITLSEASRFGGRNTSFSLMLKPVGSKCNLRCAYCYYLDKASSVYSGREPVMSLELLELCIRDFCDSCDLPELTVEWHGGEPLLAGMDFFRSALALERKYSGGRPVHNTLQTNGTLLDGEWAAFFHDNNFLLGLSLDGPEDIHDRYRRTVSGGGTFREVMHALEVLHRRMVEFNTLTTVSKAGEGRGSEVYRFLKSAGSQYMQFMPVYEHLAVGDISGQSFMPQASSADAGSACAMDAGVARMASPEEPETVLAPWSVDPEAFGRYLCDVFDVWVRGDVGQYFVLTFDAALSSWCGVQPGICTFCESCGGNLTVEHNGDIYPCDHFVYPQWRLGNIRDISLRDAATSGRLASFGVSKRNSLPPVCLRCEWMPACCGGCPKHRFVSSSGDIRPLNALCSGYRLFYSHIAPVMDKMKALLSEGRAPSELDLSDIQ